MPRRTPPAPVPNPPDSPLAVLPNPANGTTAARKPPYSELPVWQRDIVDKLLAHGPTLEPHNAREFDWDRFVSALLLPKYWPPWSRALRTCAAVRAHSSQLHLADEGAIIQAIVRLVVGAALHHIRQGDNAVTVQRHINTVVDRQLDENKLRIIHVVKLVFLLHGVRCLTWSPGNHSSYVFDPAVEALTNVQQEAVRFHALDHRQRDPEAMLYHVVKCQLKLRSIRASALFKPWWYTLPQAALNLKHSHWLSLSYIARIFVVGLPNLPQFAVDDSTSFAVWLQSVSSERWKLLGMAVSIKHMDPFVVANVILKAIGEANVENNQSPLSLHVIRIHTNNGTHFHTFVDYLQYYATQMYIMLAHFDNIVDAISQGHFPLDD